MVLLGGITDLIAGKSSASGVYRETANMQLGFMGDLNFTPEHHTNYLRNLRDTVEKSHGVSGDQLIEMKGQNSALRAGARVQAQYFALTEDRVNTHVDMVKQETSHQLKLLTASSKLAQIQRSAIDGAANLAQSNALNYAAFNGNMQVMTRGASNASYSIL